MVDSYIRALQERGQALLLWALSMKIKALCYTNHSSHFSLSNARALVHEKWSFAIQESEATTARRAAAAAAQTPQGEKWGMGQMLLFHFSLSLPCSAFSGLAEQAGNALSQHTGK